MWRNAPAVAAFFIFFWPYTHWSAIAITTVVPTNAWHQQNGASNGGEVWGDNRNEPPLVQFPQVYSPNQPEARNYYQPPTTKAQQVDPGLGETQDVQRAFNQQVESPQPFPTTQNRLPNERSATVGNGIYSTLPVYAPSHEDRIQRDSVVMAPQQIPLWNNVEPFYPVGSQPPVQIQNNPSLPKSQQTYTNPTIYDQARLNNAEATSFILPWSSVRDLRRFPAPYSNSNPSLSYRLNTAGQELDMGNAGPLSNIGMNTFNGEGGSFFPSPEIPKSPHFFYSRRGLETPEIIPPPSKTPIMNALPQHQINSLQTEPRLHNDEQTIVQSPAIIGGVGNVSYTDIPQPQLPQDSPFNFNQNQNNYNVPRKLYKQNPTTNDQMANGAGYMISNSNLQTPPYPESIPSSLPVMKEGIFGSPNNQVKPSPAPFTPNIPMHPDDFGSFTATQSGPSVSPSVSELHLENSASERGISVHEYYDNGKNVVQNNRVWQNGESLLIPEEQHFNVHQPEVLYSNHRPMNTIVLPGVQTATLIDKTHQPPANNIVAPTGFFQMPQLPINGDLRKYPLQQTPTSDKSSEGGVLKNGPISKDNQVMNPVDTLPFTISTRGKYLNNPVGAFQLVRLVGNTGEDENLIPNGPSPKDRVSESGIHRTSSGFMNFKAPNDLHSESHQDDDQTKNSELTLEDGSGGNKKGFQPLPIFTIESNRPLDFPQPLQEWITRYKTPYAQKISNLPYRSVFHFITPQHPPPLDPITVGTISMSPFGIITDAQRSILERITDQDQVYIPFSDQSMSPGALLNSMNAPPPKATVSQNSPQESNKSPGLLNKPQYLQPVVDMASNSLPADIGSRLNNDRTYSKSGIIPDSYDYNNFMRDDSNKESTDVNTESKVNTQQLIYPGADNRNAYSLPNSKTTGDDLTNRMPQSSRPELSGGKNRWVYSHSDPTMNQNVIPLDRNPSNKNSGRAEGEYMKPSSRYVPAATYEKIQDVKMPQSSAPNVQSDIGGTSIDKQRAMPGGPQPNIEYKRLEAIIPLTQREATIYGEGPPPEAIDQKYIEEQIKASILSTLNKAFMEDSIHHNIESDQAFSQLSSSQLAIKLSPNADGSVISPSMDKYQNSKPIKQTKQDSLYETSPYLTSQTIYPENTSLSNNKFNVKGSGQRFFDTRDKDRTYNNDKYEANTQGLVIDSQRESNKQFLVQDNLPIHDFEGVSSGWPPAQGNLDELEKLRHQPVSRNTSRSSHIIELDGLVVPVNKLSYYDNGEGLTKNPLDTQERQSFSNRNVASNTLNSLMKETSGKYSTEDWYKASKQRLSNNPYSEQNPQSFSILQGPLNMDMLSQTQYLEDGISDTSINFDTQRTFRPKLKSDTSKPSIADIPKQPHYTTQSRPHPSMNTGGIENSPQPTYYEHDKKNWNGKLEAGEHLAPKIKKVKTNIQDFDEMDKTLEYESTLSTQSNNQNPYSTSQLPTENGNYIVTNNNEANQLYNLGMDDVYQKHESKPMTMILMSTGMPLKYVKENISGNRNMQPRSSPDSERISWIPTANNDKNMDHYTITVQYPEYADMPKDYDHERLPGSKNMVSKVHDEAYVKDPTEQQRNNELLSKQPNNANQSTTTYVTGSEGIHFIPQIVNNEFEDGILTTTFHGQYKGAVKVMKEPQNQEKPKLSQTVDTPQISNKKKEQGVVTGLEKHQRDTHQFANTVQYAEKTYATTPLFVSDGMNIIPNKENNTGSPDTADVFDENQNLLLDSATMTHSDLEITHGAEDHNPSALYGNRNLRPNILTSSPASKYDSASVGHDTDQRQDTLKQINNTKEHKIPSVVGSVDEFERDSATTHNGEYQNPSSLVIKAPIPARFTDNNEEQYTITTYDHHILPLRTATKVLYPTLTPLPVEYDHQGVTGNINLSLDAYDKDYSKPYSEIAPDKVDILSQTMNNVYEEGTPTSYGKDEVAKEFQSEDQNLQRPKPSQQQVDLGTIEQRYHLTNNNEYYSKYDGKEPYTMVYNGIQRDPSIVAKYRENTKLPENHDQGRLTEDINEKSSTERSRQQNEKLIDDLSSKPDLHSGQRSLGGEAEERSYSPIKLSSQNKNKLKLLSVTSDELSNSKVVRNGEKVYGEYKINVKFISGNTNREGSKLSQKDVDRGNMDVKYESSTTADRKYLNGYGQTIDQIPNTSSTPVNHNNLLESPPISSSEEYRVLHSNDEMQDTVNKIMPLNISSTNMFHPTENEREQLNKTSLKQLNNIRQPTQYFMPGSDYLPQTLDSEFDIADATTHHVQNEELSEAIIKTPNHESSAHLQQDLQATDDKHKLSKMSDELNLIKNNEESDQQRNITLFPKVLTPENMPGADSMNNASHTDNQDVTKQYQINAHDENQIHSSNRTVDKNPIMSSSPGTIQMDNGVDTLGQNDKVLGSLSSKTHSYSGQRTLGEETDEGTDLPIKSPSQNRNQLNLPSMTLGGPSKSGSLSIPSSEVGNLKHHMVFEGDGTTTYKVINHKTKLASLEDLKAPTTYDEYTFLSKLSDKLHPFENINRINLLSPSLPESYTTTRIHDTDNDDTTTQYNKILHDTSRPVKYNPGGITENRNKISTTSGISGINQEQTSEGGMFVPQVEPRPIEISYITTNTSDPDKDYQSSKPLSSPYFNVPDSSQTQETINEQTPGIRVDITVGSTINQKQPAKISPNTFKSTFQSSGQRLIESELKTAERMVEGQHKQANSFTGTTSENSYEYHASEKPFNSQSMPYRAADGSGDRSKSNTIDSQLTQQPALLDTRIPGYKTRAGSVQVEATYESPDDEILFHNQRSSARGGITYFNTSPVTQPNGSQDQDRGSNLKWMSDMEMSEGNQNNKVINSSESFKNHLEGTKANVQIQAPPIFIGSYSLSPLSTSWSPDSSPAYSDHTDSLGNSGSSREEDYGTVKPQFVTSFSSTSDGNILSKFSADSNVDRIGNMLKSSYMLSPESNRLTHPENLSLISNGRNETDRTAINPLVKLFKKLSNLTAKLQTSSYTIMDLLGPPQLQEQQANKEIFNHSSAIHLVNIEATKKLQSNLSPIIGMDEVDQAEVTDRASSSVRGITMPQLGWKKVTDPTNFTDTGRRSLAQNNKDELLVTTTPSENAPIAEKITIDYIANDNLENISSPKPSEQEETERVTGSDNDHRYVESSYKDLNASQQGHTISLSAIDQDTINEDMHDNTTNIIMTQTGWKLRQHSQQQLDAEKHKSNNLNRSKEPNEAGSYSDISDSGVTYRTTSKQHYPYETNVSASPLSNDVTKYGEVGTRTGEKNTLQSQRFVDLLDSARRTLGGEIDEDAISKFQNKSKSKLSSIIPLEPIKSNVEKNGELEYRTKGTSKTISSISSILQPESSKDLLGQNNKVLSQQDSETHVYSGQRTLGEEEDKETNLPIISQDKNRLKLPSFKSDEPSKSSILPNSDSEIHPGETNPMVSSSFSATQSLAANRMGDAPKAFLQNIAEQPAYFENGEVHEKCPPGAEPNPTVIVEITHSPIGKIKSAVATRSSSTTKSERNPQNRRREEYLEHNTLGKNNEVLSDVPSKANQVKGEETGIGTKLSLVTSGELLTSIIVPNSELKGRPEETIPKVSSFLSTSEPDSLTDILERNIRGHSDLSSKGHQVTLGEETNKGRLTMPSITSGRPLASGIVPNSDSEGSPRETMPKVSSSFSDLQPESSTDIMEQNDKVITDISSKTHAYSGQRTLGEETDEGTNLPNNSQRQNKDNLKLPPATSGEPLTNSFVTNSESEDRPGESNPNASSSSSNLQPESSINILKQKNNLISELSSETHQVTLGEHIGEGTSLQMISLSHNKDKLKLPSVTSGEPSAIRVALNDESEDRPGETILKVTSILEPESSTDILEQNPKILSDINSKTQSYSGQHTLEEETDHNTSHPGEIIPKESLSLRTFQPESSTDISEQYETHTYSGPRTLGEEAGDDRNLPIKSVSQNEDNLKLPLVSSVHPSSNNVAPKNESEGSPVITIPKVSSSLSNLQPESSTGILEQQDKVLGDISSKRPYIGQHTLGERTDHDTFHQGEIIPNESSSLSSFDQPQSSTDIIEQNDKKYSNVYSKRNTYSRQHTLSEETGGNTNLQMTLDQNNDKSMLPSVTSGKPSTTSIVPNGEPGSRQGETITKVTIFSSTLEPESSTDILEQNDKELSDLSSKTVAYPSQRSLGGETDGDTNQMKSPSQNKEKSMLPTVTAGKPITDNIVTNSESESRPEETILDEPNSLSNLQPESSTDILNQNNKAPSDLSSETKFYSDQRTLGGKTGEGTNLPMKSPSQNKEKLPSVTSARPSTSSIATNGESGNLPGETIQKLSNTSTSQLGKSTDILVQNDRILSNLPSKTVAYSGQRSLGEETGEGTNLPMESLSQNKEKSKLASVTSGKPSTSSNALNGESERHLGDIIDMRDSMSSRGTTLQPERSVDIFEQGKTVLSDPSSKTYSLSAQHTLGGATYLPIKIPSQEINTFNTPPILTDELEDGLEYQKALRTLQNINSGNFRLFSAEYFIQLIQRCNCSSLKFLIPILQRPDSGILVTS